jgi:hypothetical protein
MRRAFRALAAIAAGTLVLFLWGALSHMVIIRGIGFSALPDDDRFAEALAGGAVQPGLYAFPAPPDWRGEATNETSTAAWDSRFRSGPSGLLTIRPAGEGPVSTRKLLVQLLANIIAVSLALLVVRWSGPSFWRRVTCVVAIGAGGLVTVGVICWNWYAFTNGFIVALGFDLLVGWLLVGCTLAAVAARSERASRAARDQKTMRSSPAPTTSV